MIAKWYKGERNTKYYIRQWKKEIEKLKEKLKFDNPDLSVKDNFKIKNLIIYKIHQIEELVNFYTRLNRIDSESEVQDGTNN